MPKETLSKKPVSLPEVVTIFNKRKKSGELNYLQRIALEHAQRSSQVTGAKAKSIIKKLMSEFELTQMIAIHIINFMPVTLDEMRVFLQDASRVYTADEAGQMLDLLRE
ncbi:MAG: RNA polymerase Rpb4 family protein [Candidatus Heimdallarchaeota archaeon]